jgi:regulator of protease activity HflC (stomatin/prohibitin superfamily)
MRRYFVPQSFVGLLYEDGAFKRILQPGKHKLKKHIFDSTRRSVTLLDMRERSLTIKGQEILTKDKVAIRVSLLVYYNVKDPAAAAHNVESYEDRIYEDVQLSARRFLAGRILEDILSDRNEISDAVREDVIGAASDYGVEIVRADVKDLMFPGNLREIMNQVLETERRAEASLIEARRDAETLRIRSLAEGEAELRRLDSEKERVRIEAEAEMGRLKLQLQSDLEQAEALRSHPELLKLRQIEALQSMASNGGRFVIGLKGEELDGVIKG